MSHGPSVFAVLLAVAVDGSRAGRAGDATRSDEASAAPRPGTLCRLVEREVLAAADPSIAPPRLAVHRLRFELPFAARVPPCCGGASGLVHVRVKAPTATVQTAARLQPYSAHVDTANRTFDIVVKIYPPVKDPPSPAVSAYLGAVAVGDYVHVPELRAWDWRRESRRMAMVCFGVGITECLTLAEPLLRFGAEVRLVYANRDAAQTVLLGQLHRLLDLYPSRFRLRLCMSAEEPGPSPSRAGERMTHGRVSSAVLKDEFGGAWGDGNVAQHYFVVGSPEMEMAALSMLGRALLVNMATLRGHPPWLAMKGPYGKNSKWEALSPLDQDVGHTEL
mmetsp:Transcript_33886/g.79337  ORF Transcript_33886/g.79337 Transcript_33886/m.79337 type:complete len:334 (-) Transcript_33886:8-1009(-)